MTYNAVLQDMYGRSTQGIKLGLDTMRALLAALGHPERRFSTVLVAGTNGKGSTSVLLAEALRYAGRRVGLYTSPHLLAFGERIRIDGEPIAAAQVVAYMARIVAVEKACPRQPTFFECATAMACMAFADAQVDIAVMEVGLGGRLDATNAIPRTTCVITRIAMDHESFLGNTLTAIAGEKADIVAHHSPVVVGPQAPEAMTVIRAVAEARGATLLPATPYAALPIGLPPYQQENVGTALAAADVLHVPRAAFAQALGAFDWPGRYEWRPGPPALLLDGAHNASGIHAFVDAVRADPRCVNRLMVGIFSAVHGKEVGAMIDALAPLDIPWFVCPTRSGRSRSADELTQVLPQAQACASVPDALAAARRAAGAEGVVAAVGSLFLVADVLGEITGAAREVTIDG